MTINDDTRRLYSHGVKRGGLNIRNPCEGAPEPHAGSKAATAALVTALVEGQHLNLGAHTDTVKDAREAARNAKIEGELAFNKLYGDARSARVRKRLARAEEVGAWLTRLPSRLEGTQTTYAEWHNNLLARYGMVPLGLPAQCDGCGAKFTKEHVMSCKKGGLVGLRHDDVADAAGTLGTMALNSSRVSYKPLIFYGTGVTAGGETEAPASPTKGRKGKSS